MKNLLHFTEKSLRGLSTAPPAKRTYFTDSVERGLRIEVRPTGTIRFFYRPRMKGKQPPYSPGRWPEVSVVQARLWLQNLKADLNRCLPVVASTSGGPRLSEFFDDSYLERYLKIHAAKSWVGEVSLFDCHIRDRLGGARLGEIERADVVDLHIAILEAVGARTANRVKVLMHRIYSFAIDEGEVRTGNPAARIKNYKEGTRSRFLMEHEMPAFFAALAGDDVKPDIRDLVTLALFTGARRANLLAIKSEDIIPGLPTWRISAEEFKGGRTHFVPLVSQAASVVSRRLKIVGDGYLFPSAGSASGHMMTPDKNWNALRESAGMADLWFHDLRATLSTWAEDMMVPDTVRAKMLGHKTGGVIERYSRSRIETVQRHFQQVADAIEAAGATPHQQKIVPLRKGATA